jgi:hypothetical protein
MVLPSAFLYNVKTPLTQIPVCKEKTDVLRLFSART